jgi:hypothetical protein
MAAIGPLGWVWVALGIPALLAFGWSVLQVQHDAEARGLPHRLVLLLAALTWPAGVLLYWLAQPNGGIAHTEGDVR